jgi:hypothetical protein
VALQLSRAVRLYGTEEAPVARRLLRAGALSVELEAGVLRYMKFGETEVLRGIAFLVRDENWGTFTPELSELQIAEDQESFSLRYRGLCQDARRRLSYRAAIAGRSDGSLSFEVTAVAETEVITNRTGFVVLHPAAVAGEPVRVIHVDGSVEESRFPELISPAQPFFDIRALSHRIGPGVWATCHMEGDAFEMEDQRNWSDASYKTYVRPLSRPWPYALAEGSRHRQAIRVEITSSIDAPARSDAGAGVEVELSGETGGRMPLIGIGLPQEECEDAAKIGELLRLLSPRLIVAHIDLRRKPKAADISALEGVNGLIDAELALEVVIADDSTPSVELAWLAERLAATRLKPAAVAVSTVADLSSWQPGARRPLRPEPSAIVAAARAFFPGARIGGGMFSYFTELNRRRPEPGLYDYIGHTTCSTVHAADDRSVMETLDALPAIIASTKAFIGGLPYRVGPSAIGCRDNPYGKAPFENPGNARVCLARMDPRQRGLFGAAWALGYVAAFARGGVEAIAMGALTGPFGHIYRRTDYMQPYYDEVADARFYPAFHMLAGLAEASTRPLLETRRSHEGTVEALAYRGAEGPVLWLANLTGEPVKLALLGLPSPARCAVLDAGRFEQAACDAKFLDSAARRGSYSELVLDAYAIARID